MRCNTFSHSSTTCPLNPPKDAPTRGRSRTKDAPFRGRSRSRPPARRLVNFNSPPMGDSSINNVVTPQPPPPQVNLQTAPSPNQSIPRENPHSLPIGPDLPVGHAIADLNQVPLSSPPSELDITKTIPQARGPEVDKVSSQTAVLTRAKAASLNSSPAQQVVLENPVLGHSQEPLSSTQSNQASSSKAKKKGKNSGNS